MAENASLVSLELGWNPLEEEGGRALLENIGRNSSLMRVGLEGTGISQEARKEIGELATMSIIPYIEKICCEQRVLRSVPYCILILFFRANYAQQFQAQSRDTLSLGSGGGRRRVEEARRKGKKPKRNADEDIRSAVLTEQVYTFSYKCSVNSVLSLKNVFKKISELTGSLSREKERGGILERALLVAEDKVQIILKKFI